MDHEQTGLDSYSGHLAADVGKWTPGESAIEKEQKTVPSVHCRGARGQSRPLMPPPPFEDAGGVQEQGAAVAVAIVRAAWVGVGVMP